MMIHRPKSEHSVLVLNIVVHHYKLHESFHLNNVLNYVYYINIVIYILLLNLHIII